MLTTTLRKVGGSVMLTVPPAILGLLHLRAGETVGVTVDGGRPVIGRRECPVQPELWIKLQAAHTYRDGALEIVTVFAGAVPRSLDGAQRNPGPRGNPLIPRLSTRPPPDSAALHPGYVGQVPNTFKISVIPGDERSPPWERLQPRRRQGRLRGRVAAEAAPTGSWRD